MEVELEDTKILWPGGVLYGGGETYENARFKVQYWTRSGLQLCGRPKAALRPAIITQFYLRILSIVHIPTLGSAAVSRAETKKGIKT